MKLVFAFALVCAAAVAADKLKFDVKILNRQDNETEYTYVLPGYSTLNSNTNVGCVGVATGAGNTVTSSATCNGSTKSTAVTMPAQQISYRVRGATFTVQLPDGRRAVVNCESKFQERFAGPRGNRRSCRVPLVDDIQAEFDGDKAKLKWPVSLDGKKLESETYKILAVFPKP